ncbi:MAG: methyltransferase domain-containing protein [Rhodospirillaceae bacterium]|nr:methyltransferase domain-containing protein [Rhodospirillaceae bacterium]
MPRSDSSAPHAQAAPAAPACRFCGTPLLDTFVDLGVTPLANAYLRPERLRAMEPHYPLHAYVCSRCLLVQVEAFETPEAMFGDYAYFSSCSQSWLGHCEAFAERAIEACRLDRHSQVVEVASNDGYLLQFFQRRGIPVLGIEPAANVAVAAVERGINTLVRFFGVETAKALAGRGRQADLLIANNVLAHVPDINDFVAGLAIALKPDGLLSLEFPHLLRLIDGVQFDTIYHEHFSYLSFTTTQRILAAHGLSVVDVEELPTHGGSLRVLARHRAAAGTVNRRVGEMRQIERDAGLDDLSSYRGFADRVRAVKHGLLRFLFEAKAEGRTVVAYGAAAKGSTLLNTCGIRGDLIDYVVDISPHKQGLHMPGSRLPIHHPDRLRETRPDYLLILPWNLKHEIMGQMAHIRHWGGKFVLAVPNLEVVAP